MAEGKVTLLDAFTAGFLMEHNFKSTSHFPLTPHRDIDLWKQDLKDDFAAWLGEDVPEVDEDEVIDLDMAYQVLDTVRQELVDQAHSGNIARKHHLESAVTCFADIGVLLRAEEIIRQAFDPREETDDEVSEVDRGDGEGEGEAGTP